MRINVLNAALLLALPCVSLLSPVSCFSVVRTAGQHHPIRSLPLWSAPPSQTVVTTTTQEPQGTTVGDTRGAALRLEDVAISRGASPLLNNLQWSVQPNERWGIVGPNGGKYELRMAAYKQLFIEYSNTHCFFLVL
jgi:ABC-type multidrug transport system fused ATPase/permease subunit